MKTWIKKHPISLTVALASIFTFGMVLWGLYGYGSSFIQDFFSNWLSTFLGVIVGVPAALLLTNHQDRINEKEHKDKILTLLRAELISNHQVLKNWYDSKDKIENTEVLFFELRTETWDAFSDGGEIQWIKNLSIVGQLANVYANIKILKKWTERNYSVLYNKERWQKLEQLYDRSFNCILISIDFIENALEIPLRQHYGFIAPPRC